MSAEVFNLNARITADVSGFQRGVQDAQRSMNTLSEELGSTLKYTESAINALRPYTEFEKKLLDQKIESVQKSNELNLQNLANSKATIDEIYEVEKEGIVKLSNLKLEQLEAEHYNAVEKAKINNESEAEINRIHEYYNNERVKIVNEANRQIEESTNKSSNKIKDGLKNWGVNLDQFYSQGSSLFNKFGINVDKFASHFGMSGKMMSGIVACTTALVKLGQEMDEARKQIALGTGAIGDALDDLERSSKKALVLGVGANVEQTGKLVADLNTRFGITGDTLEQTTVQFGKFAKVAGIDVSGAVNKMADVMARWNIPLEQSDELMNQLTSASQMSGASVDELISSVTTGQTYFKQFGYSLSDSVALLSNFRKNGIQTSSVLMGMRTALAKFSKEGKDAKQGMEEVSKAIQNASSDTEAMAIACETFGTRSGPEMFQAIKNGCLDIEEFKNAMVEANSALEDTYDASRTSKDAMNDLMNSLKGTFGGFGQAFSALWKGLLDTVTEFVRFFEPLITPIAEVVKFVFQKIAALITWIVREVRKGVQENESCWKWMVKTFNDAGKLIKGVLDDLFSVIKDTFGLIISIINGDWDKAWIQAQLIVLKFSRAVSKICDGIANIFVDLINGVGDLINKGWVEWIKFTTDLYENSGGFIDITGAGKQFSAWKKEFNEIYKDTKEADKAFSDYIKGFMKGSGMAFKALDHITLADIKVGGVSMNDYIADLEKQLDDLEKKSGKVDLGGDPTATMGTYALGASETGGGDDEKKAKESQVWIQKRLQQQLDAITQEKEARLNALREEGATQEQLDAINAVFAERQIAKYNELQAIKKANDEESIKDVANIEEEKLNLEQWYADEAEKYRVEVSTNTVKAIEKVETQSTEWKMKLLQQEIDALEEERALTVETMKAEGKTAQEINEAQLEYLNQQIDKTYELMELKKKASLESAKNAEEQAEIEQYYSNETASETSKVWNKLITKADEKAKASGNKFVQIMAKIGSTIKKVVDTAVKVIKKGFDMAWKIIQFNPDEFLDDLLKVADTIETFFIETVPRLPGIVDSVGNCIEVIADTITKPEVIDTLMQAIEDVVIKAVDWMTKNVKRILGSLGKLVGAIIRALGKVISEIDWFQLLGEVLGGLWDAIASIGQGLWDGIVSVFSKIGEWISNWWNNLWKTVGNWWNNMWKGVGNWFKGIFGFATGTNNAPSGLALVGERGPELIDLHGGERIYNTDSTRDILSGGSSGSSNVWNVTFNNTVDTTAYTMMRQLKGYQRQMAVNGII